MLPFIKALEGLTGVLGCTFAALCRHWRRAVRFQGYGSLVRSRTLAASPAFTRLGMGAPGVGRLNGRPRPSVFPLGL